MNNFEQNTISEILSCADNEQDNDIDSRLFGLPLTLGENAENADEYDYAFRILVSLCKRKNAQVRANAILGLAYLARTSRRLDKGIVLPLIKRVWEQNSDNRSNIECAIDDINQFLHWGIDKDKL